MEGLHIYNLTVSIKDKLILDNISFNVQPGSITVLIGHNGAGKSTIMKSIIGWEEKDSGEILLNNLSQEENFIEFKQRISYLPEEPFLLSELTVMQHFQLYGKSYQLSEAELYERVDKYIKKMEIEDKLNEYPESLSKGMRQKVQTICALLPDTDLLIIDEPFMGLDVYATNYLETVMIEKAKSGTSILLTSHQLDRIQEFANYYLMLHQGRLVDQGKMEDFQTLKRRYDQ